MHKLKKNIATAVALTMVISGFAPTSEAYSISNNSNNSIFSRILNLIGNSQISIGTVRFIKKGINGEDSFSSNPLELKADEKAVRVRLLTYGGDLSNITQNDVEIQLKDTASEEVKNVKITKMEKKNKNIDLDLEIPENTKFEAIKYEIKFRLGKDGAYSDALFINQEAKVPTEAIINSFSSEKKEITDTEAEYSFSAKGINLEKSKLSLQIKDKDGKDVTDEIFKYNKKDNDLSGAPQNATVKSIRVKFPIDDLSEGAAKKYTVLLKKDNAETNKSVVLNIEKPKVTSLIKNVNTKTPNIPSKGESSEEQTVKFTLTVDSKLSNENIVWKTNCNGIGTSDLKVSLDEGTGETRTGSIVVPANKRANDKKYTIEFADKTYNNYNTVLTITQFGDQTIKAAIQAVEPNEIKDIPVEGQKISFSVMTKGVKKDDLGVKVTSNGEKVDIKDIVIEGELAEKKVTMTIPENKETKEKVYKVEFCVDKAKEEYEGNPYLTVTQKASEAPKELKVTSFEAIKADLPKEGGTTTVTATGENLDKSKLSLKVEKILSSGKEDVSDKIKGSFYGTEDLMSANLTFPKIDKEDDIDKYEVSLLVNGVVKFTDKITVSKYGTLAETTPFGLAGVYMDGENRIVLESYERIYEIIPNSLKENISLKIVTDKKESKDGFVKLGEKDKVELRDKFIIITLENPIDIKNLDVTQSKVRIEKRVLKNSNDLPFGELEHIINKDVPVVHEYEFISGEILDSKGGEVAVKLNGINLVNPNGVEIKDSDKKATRVKVFKKENLNSNIKYLDGVKVEGEGNEQIIRFTLPANKGKRTESYTVMISLDNGKTYSPEVGVNMLDSRGTRISPSVLPEGKTSSEPTLAFASIQSYGTAGGGGIVDNTHTDTPTNQESKKTFVHLYGTNLRKNTTKVRIKHIDTDTNKYEDGNKGTGAIFVPTNESNQDSGNRFIMIAFDGTGIIGDGNHQQLEIIAPRGYRGTNTWEYQFAVDGVNFDEKNTLTVTVVNDHEEQLERPLPSEAIRTLVVKHLTEDGKEVAKQEEHKVFKGQQFYTSDIAPKEIKGYKYLGTKEVKDAKARLEELNKKSSLTDKEKEEKAKLENLFKHVVNQKFKDLEMTYTNNPGTEGVLTFLYEDTNPTKPVEPSIPSEPSKPSKPEEKPEKPGEGVRVEVVDKIAGENRYETSLDISNKVYSSSQKVYLVSGEKFPDALSSAALAGQGDGPILLINDQNIDKILAEINRLGAKEIVFVGGNSISKANEAKIKAFAEEKSSVVSAFAGEDRYETAIKVAEETIAKRGNKGKVIIADGRNYPDAVSIAPYASKEGIPVILVNGNKVPDEVKAFLNKHKIKEAIIVGGTKAVGKDVEKLFSDFERIAGEDRYDTSKKIAERFFADSKTIFVASGESFADSLSVSYYAGNQNAPVLLTKANSLDDDTRDYLNANKDKNYIIIGGDKAINPNLFK